MRTLPVDLLGDLLPLFPPVAFALVVVLWLCCGCVVVAVVPVLGGGG